MEDQRLIAVFEGKGDVYCVSGDSPAELFKYLEEMVKTFNVSIGGAEVRIFRGRQGFDDHVKATSANIERLVKAVSDANTGRAILAGEIERNAHLLKVLQEAAAEWPDEVNGYPAEDSEKAV